MSTAHGPESRLAILLGGGVREALMAQPLLRACEGASVFTSGDALGTLLGLPSVGRAFVFDDSPGELLRLFRRLRAGPISTVVVPFPARFLHLALAYFAGVPRRLMVAGANDWAATERVTAVHGMHPVEANWRLASAAGNRPVPAPGDAPTLHPPEAVRAKAVARWSAFIGGGRRPLVLIPGGGGWSSGRAGQWWPGERFAVVANHATAERVVLLSGIGDERVVRETRAGIAKPTTVVKLADMTVDEMAVLSELSLAVIGHDGDALHVAAAAGAVVIAVARRPDIPPMGDRVVALWADDFAKFPARHVVEALFRQARIDTYA